MNAIKTPADYEAALARITALMGATPDSPEEQELARLADLVDAHEQTHATAASAMQDDPA
jgi:antitoxin component HigA of HigAB toxin-antitoxin module